MGPSPSLFHSHAPCLVWKDLRSLGSGAAGAPWTSIYVQAFCVISPAWCLLGSWTSYMLAQGSHSLCPKREPGGSYFLTQLWKSHIVTSAHYWLRQEQRALQVEGKGTQIPSINRRMLISLCTKSVWDETCSGAAIFGKYCLPQMQSHSELLIGFFKKNFYS